MIEWIKITPETEFSKRPIICSDDNDYDVFWWSTEYGFRLIGCEECIQEHTLPSNYSYYSIINLPSDNK